MNNLIAELQWRGMVQDIMPGTEEYLMKEMVTGYVGFDPTAESLHIGSLVPILLLLHLQRCGHKPIALVGGATGMVGDPTGKSEERNLLDEETLAKNAEGIRRQLEKYLDFDPSLPNRAEMANNYDWFANISFLDFIRDTGKHITVNYMMSKDSVKKRLNSEVGMSFTEFTYQLIQGYDFYWLYQNKACKLQMGGSDQWGNIVTGTELIRRRLPGAEAFAFTCPLIKKADGGKFGKTEQGNIWLDPEKTSPYHFYQFWLNASDHDAATWIKIFTFLPENEVIALLDDHSKDPGQRTLQKKLAEEVTRFVHGKEELEKAMLTTEKLFNQQHGDINSMSETDLKGIEGIIRSSLPLGSFPGMDIVSFLTETSIFQSKGEAKKMLQNGGVSINRSKVSDLQLKMQENMLLHGRYVLVQKGKKNYFLVEIS